MVSREGFKRGGEKKLLEKTAAHEKGLGYGLRGVLVEKVKGEISS